MQGNTYSLLQCGSLALVVDSCYCSVYYFFRHTVSNLLAFQKKEKKILIVLLVEKGYTVEKSAGVPSNTVIP